ncbi:hypothetical protein OEZ85_013194 [Tetradesmus obliquus]|uniref:Histone deacetylase domain-containing protein n=1 Tax=Tetradesmus obliquus TaxID=3088 RepID=A0ABY8U8X9_TETOB|nr:hypothetical protein OEZ85_013194 [Tetradesmus obliquus]
MPKDYLLYLALQAEGLAQLTFTPTYPDAATLCLAHDPQYVESFLNGSISQQQMRSIGLPWSQQLVQRTLIGTGSAVLAARLALQYGVACMCNGGTHHAHRAHGSGWCIFNDLAVAGKAAQRDAGIGQVLMLDLDVHQGDGSATIFADDPSVFTFSMHCGQQSFPAVVQQSDWDIPLPAGTGDAEYLQVLQEALPALLQRVQPELVLYNAGVDVHRDDALGKLALSNEGIAQRDHAVFSACAEFGVPVACAIGGGYQEDHSHIVQRHLHLHRAAAEHMPAFGRVMDAKREAARRARNASKQQQQQQQQQQLS